MVITDEDPVAAEALVKAELMNQPKAVSAWYDHRVSHIVVGLDNGLELAFPPPLAQGLEHATPAELSVIEISPSATACIGRHSTLISDG